MLFFRDGIYSQADTCDQRNVPSGEPVNPVTGNFRKI